MKIFSVIFFSSILLLIISCQDNTPIPLVSSSIFGKLKTGEEVTSYVLRNKNKMIVKIINYGATVVSIKTEDKNKKFEDVVLGYDNIESYVKDKSYFGVIVGRYGNRIGKGKFTLDGKEYELTINDGNNQLHGGIVGFNKMLWKGEAFATDSSQSVKLTLVSKDGDQGFPGNLTLQVVYTLNNSNELEITYRASSDKTTVLNPTHHSYFNLTGNPANTILDHELVLNSEEFTPVDKELIPTGILQKVENTPMDFRKPTKIGERINSNFEQLTLGRGYDHNWVLNNFDGSVREAATVYEKNSGRFLQVFTDQPGIQFYSGNFLDGTAKGKNNIIYNYRTGFCLETQHFPDSPNKANFPSVKLEPGKTYKQKTIYKFSVK